MTVLYGFLPIWAITAVGWAAGRFDVLGKQAQSVLGGFAFAFAMPALLFVTLSRARISDLARPGVAVFAASVLIMLGLGLLIGRWLFHRGPAEGAVGAMAGAYVNSANLGIPVAVHVLGDASFMVAAALFQTLFVTPVILTLMDLDAGRGEGIRRRVLRLPLRNPIIAASAAGLAVAACGLRLPEALSAPAQMLGGAAVPAALFALGMSLNTPRADTGGAGIGGANTHGPKPRRAGSGGAGPVDAPPEKTAPAERAERYVFVTLKTVVQPLLAYALARWLFGLEGPDLLAVVLCAGLPTAQNAFIFASQYRLDTRLASDTVVLSTLFSMGSLSLIAWLLA
ncbi:AEC family transporter [Streptomyces sp. NPDC003023]|uniref:AEC family transporter n=1 Tax=Streptomyces sp. NPDC003023 TaxID=3364675 RepID=UPI0036A2CFBF